MKITENVIRSIRPHDEKAYEDVELIITTHALGAYVAAVASGWIPGAGETIATGIALAFTCTMYYRLAKRMELNLPRNVLKGIASVIISEIVIYIVAVLAIATVLTFIPGIGNVSGSLLAGLLNFCVVQTAGELFLITMSKLFRAKTASQIEEMSPEELKAFAKGCSTRKVVKDCIKQAKEDYSHVKDDSRLKAAAAQIVPEEQ